MTPFTQCTDGTLYTFMDLDTVQEDHNNCWCGLTSDHSAIIFCGHGTKSGVLKYDEFSGLSLHDFEEAAGAYLREGDPTDLPIYIICCFPKDVAVRHGAASNKKVHIVGDWHQVTVATLNPITGLVRVEEDKWII